MISINYFLALKVLLQLPENLPPAKKTMGLYQCRAKSEPPVNRKRAHEAVNGCQRLLILTFFHAHQNTN
jgi:hypothetical protein